MLSVPSNHFADRRTELSTRRPCPSRGRDGNYSPPTGSPEAVARPRFPQNPACRFPAPGSSAVGSQHRECLHLPMRETQFWSQYFRCYLLKFRCHGRLIFSLHRRPCLPLHGAHVTQEQVQQKARYSMTSSALNKSDEGMVIPSARAVRMLSTVSNFVGRLIGTSPGLAPRRTLPARTPVS